MSMHTLTMYYQQSDIAAHYPRISGPLLPLRILHMARRAVYDTAFAMNPTRVARRYGNHSFTHSSGLSVPLSTRRIPQPAVTIRL